MNRKISEIPPCDIPLLGIAVYGLICTLSFSIIGLIWTAFVCGLYAKTRRKRVAQIGAYIIALIGAAIGTLVPLGWPNLALAFFAATFLFITGYLFRIFLRN